MMTQTELIIALPSIYQCLQIPIYLLDNQIHIKYSTPSFFLQLETDYFQSIVDLQKLNQYKIYTCFKDAAFFFFSYPLEDVSYVVLGPIFSKKMTTKDKPSDYEILKHVIQPYTLNDFMNMPYVFENLNQNIAFAYQIITGQNIAINELKLNFIKPSTDPLKQEETLNQELFEIRENSLHDFSYEYEKKIINCIQNENSTQARILLSELLQIRDERHLSQNQMQSSKYKVVSAIAIFTRSVIDVGVPVAKAYTLSDVYIMKTDQCQTSQQIYKVISDAITDFTHLVKRYKHIQNPYWVKSCKAYISHHLHQHITLDELAQEVDMNPSYLSSQFKKITGQSLKQYINCQKIKEAQFLIKNSHYSLLEIADILQFSSQSHFQKVFKDITGMSPAHYKNSK